MPVMLEQRWRRDFPETEVDCLDIGLVNNMPDAAIETTERQFVELLSAARGAPAVRLHLFSMPQVPRSESTRSLMSGRYADIGALWESRLDGLVVTGTEPRAAALVDEPYWDCFTRIVDWAEESAVASVWSCLAAHAAVLHRDGIERHPLKEKRFGLYDCAQTADHPLLHGVPFHVRVAHSRWNELGAVPLMRAGYIVLTRATEAGVDAFVKQGRALALFFQGHPEYDGRALLREFRRDVGRFLRGERVTYPGTPRGYFARGALPALTAFRERALAERHENLLAQFPMVAAQAGLTPTCDSPATRIYGNWLAYLASQKALRSQVTTQAGVAPIDHATPLPLAESLA
jgi:homoserine O-succinyltransferase